MPRAPFQILVFPYRITLDDIILYAVFKRADTDNDLWQAIAGGGEDDETPLKAAKREAREEAGIPEDSEFIQLDSCNTVPVMEVCGALWGDDILVLPEYCFGVRVTGEGLRLSREHGEYRWLSYDEARAVLRWDSNRNALWELDYRLKKNLG
ncbi:MAG: NUDIX pyrophosphatase [Candidatus Zixiibacteriota bacterium]|nr:MAG: NUDIX pyrophosphatase [candidate division Zixibacteria bacterium]